MEDVVRTGSGIQIILDGVSRDRENGVYPNPSPAKEASDIVADTVFETISKNLDSADINGLIYNAAAKANDMLIEFNKENACFPSGTVGIFSVIKDDVFYYAYIGDSSGRLIRSGEVTLFTEHQTKRVVENKAKLTTHEIRNVICNNKEHPFSYGVINGDSRAMDFLVSGSFEVHGGDVLILSTDGAEDYLSSLSAEKLAELSADDIVRNALGFKEVCDDTAVVVVGL